MRSSSENAPSASFSHVDMLWKKHGSSMFQWNTKNNYNLAICFCEWTKMNTHWSSILVWREGYKVLTRTQIVCCGRKTVQCFTSKLVCKTRCDISILPQEFLVEWIEPISRAPCTGEKKCIVEIYIYIYIYIICVNCIIHVACKQVVI